MQSIEYTSSQVITCRISSQAEFTPYPEADGVYKAKIYKNPTVADAGYVEVYGTIIEVHVWTGAAYWMVAFCKKHIKNQAPEMALVKKDNENERALVKYTIMDKSKINSSTMIYKMISVVEALVEKCEYNKPILVSNINKRLLESKYYELESKDIYSLLWYQISRTKSFETTNKIVKSSLLFWKEKSGWYVMLTK